VSRHPIALLIEKADKAISGEDFDTVVDLYADDAVLLRFGWSFNREFVPATGFAELVVSGQGPHAA